jgi:hypothetical protein
MLPALNERALRAQLGTIRHCLPAVEEIGRYEE